MAAGAPASPSSIAPFTQKVLTLIRSSWQRVVGAARKVGKPSSLVASSIRHCPNAPPPAPSPVLAVQIVGKAQTPRTRGLRACPPPILPELLDARAPSSSGLRTAAGEEQACLEPASESPRLPPCSFPPVSSATRHNTRRSESQSSCLADFPGNMLSPGLSKYKYSTTRTIRKAQGRCAASPLT